MSATVLGGGAFGTSLALMLARKGEFTHVRVWNPPQDKPEEVNSHRENKRFLPGVMLPERIVFTSDVKAACEDTKLVLVCIPSHHLAGFFRNRRDCIPTGPPLVLCGKGIDTKTLQLPYHIVVEALNDCHRAARLAVMAGPSFAREVAQGKPTCVSVAAYNPRLANEVCAMLSDPHAQFLCHASGDVIGSEVAGAVKNVCAIASGLTEGLEYGANGRAAIITMGLNEMRTLILAMGGTGEAVCDYAGVGDLTLTCSSMMSRNFTVGKRLALGEDLKTIQSSIGVAEGVLTSHSIYQLQEKYQISMPVCTQVYRIVHKGKDPRKAFAELYGYTPKQAKL